MTSPDVAPTWTALDCTVYVDGVRVQDGSLLTDTDALPTVLAGLEVNWGRATTVDQPAPATAAFTLLDLDGTRGFLELVKVGRRLTIRAGGKAFSGVVQTVVDPSFASLPAGTVLDGDTGQVIAWFSPAAPSLRGKVQKGLTGGLDFSRRPGGVDNAGSTVLLMPAPSSTDPTAWDSVPRTAVGQAWRFAITIAGLPVDMGLSAAAVGMSTPNQERPAVTGLTGWHALHNGVNTIDFSVFATGEVWAGIELFYYSFTNTYFGWSRHGTTAEYHNDPTYLEEATRPAMSPAPPNPTYSDLESSFRVVSYTITGPAATSVRTVNVFDGRITDADASWDMDAGGVAIDVTAVDTLGELAAMNVATAPLPVQAVSARLAAVTAAAGYTGALQVDASSAGRLVTAIDIDKQSALQVINDMTAGLDLILWGATHIVTGPYLWIEDIRNRPALLELVMGGGGLVEIEPITVVSDDYTVIDACDVLLEPVHWVQDVSDVSTRAAVTWQDNTVNPAAGVTIERRSSLDSNTGPYGVRSVSVTSQVTTSAEAYALADQFLARLSFAGWRIAGLDMDLRSVEDMTPSNIERALDLLDGTTRIGRPVQLTGLPAWSPTTGPQGLYLEGGKYVYTGRGWDLQFNLSSANAVGDSVTYVEVDPAWRYVDFDPSITYNKLIGVGP